MSKNSMSLKKCRRQLENKRQNQDKDPEVKTMRIDNEIVDPLRKSPCDVKFSGHSTPIQKKDHAYNVEYSPELDYRCSPIFLPCTQEGGNEVAWDWQSSKPSKETRNDCVTAETPKRKKLLQKKRNSNSPLLQKSLKRKQAKRENMEGIGKLAAELKALTEKMSTIRQNDEAHMATDRREFTIKQSASDTQLLIEIDDCNSGKILSGIHIKDEKQNGEPVITDSGSKGGSSYEDLFDDSINESMVKCSQEIEQKYLGTVVMNGGTRLPPANEAEELLLTDERTTPCSTSSNYSTDISGNSNASKNAFNVNVTNSLKTYSKNPVQASSTFDNHIPSSKDQDVQKPYCNNNIINKCSKQTLLDTNKSGFFEIPDDSFDDCLATCLEDEKLHCDNKYLEGIFSDKYNSVQSRDIKHSDTKNVGATVTSSSSNVIENRKFFKTKNLMDQLLQQERNTNTNNKTSRPPLSRHSSANSVLESPKRFSAGSLVSTGFSTTENHNSTAAKNILPNNSVETVHALNRSAGKEGGTRIVKYKSTSCLLSSKKEIVQCTPAEIERKRLEAKMKLEAKRKLQQTLKSNNTQRELSIKGRIKR